MINDFKMSVLKTLGRTRVIPFRFRDKVIRSFLSPDQMPNKEFQNDFFGLKFLGNIENFIEWYICFYGAYERQLLRFLKSIAKKMESNCVFVDVGANVGQHSLFMSKYCSHVHSFEPWDGVLNTLKRNLILNKIKNVTTYSVGLGNEDKSLPFYTPYNFCNKGSSSFIADHNEKNTKALDLPIVRADAYFKKQGIEKIDIVKIDVEGFEKFVLEGLKHSLQEHRPVIIVEISETTQKYIKSAQDLLRLLPENYTLKNFKDRHDLTYALLDFSYENLPGDVVLCPREKSYLIER